MVAVTVVAVAQGDANGGETGWVVSRVSRGAGSTRAAPGVVALNCGLADCVVAAEASWWGVWEVASAGQVSIQQAAPNSLCRRLRDANHGLNRSH